MIGVSIFRAWYSKQRQNQLGIDRYGITLRTLRSDVTLIPWTNIEAIAVTDVGAVAGRGDSICSGVYLGIRLDASSDLRISEQCSGIRQFCDYDFLQEDKYGASLDEMESLLLKAQRTAKSQS